MNKAADTDEHSLAEAVSRAKAGDAGALEQVVAAIQDDVYRLALRMTAHRQDAEDASQEIPVKVVTRLEGFRGESSLRTWAYRIGVRHMLDRKKSRVEAFAFNFGRFGDDLLDGLAAWPIACIPSSKRRADSSSTRRSAWRVTGKRSKARLVRL